MVMFYPNRKISIHSCSYWAHFSALKNLLMNSLFLQLMGHAPNSVRECFDCGGGRYAGLNSSRRAE
jgi:hypothetical protein